MHRPEMWGIVQFTSKPSNENISEIPGKTARDLALEIYYAQRDFRNAHQRRATNLAELKFSTNSFPPGVEMTDLEPTADGFTCSVVFKAGERRRVWRIRQDRLLKLDEPMPVETGFSREEAKRFVSIAWEDIKKARTTSAAEELAAKKIAIGDKSLKWMEQTFGDAPDGQHSLWITMHGGGQGTEEGNDRNWRGYFGRYEFPPGGINVAPRAPANTWDMWHVKWVDDLFDRLIADLVLQRGVDPNQVYLIGYSAGGDGVYQLAPRLADRFAAAAMCAGHPNEVTPEGLRNLPFFLYMGGADSAYNRNVVVGEFSAKMDVLQAADPAGYPHRLTVFPGLPHHMQNREAEFIPRMSPLRRVAWPKRVVWKQDDDAVHTRFYWLERAPDTSQPNEIYAAHLDGQSITIETPGSGSVTLRLSDALLDLDRPVKVSAGGRVIFEGKVARSFAAIAQSLQEREDSETVATALLPVLW
jgi:predicted esterase